MKKKIGIILIIIAILIAGLMLLRIYKKSKCGDGICQKWEQDKKSCSKDCFKPVETGKQESACNVKSMEKIGNGSFPRVSPKDGKITFTREVDNQFEVFVMNNDGSGEYCLTCNKDALKENRNRGQSAWLPDGKYITFTGETTKYPRKGTGATARPGIGRNNNIWIAKADGSSFWRLTDYPDNWGAIEPYFSHNGKMLAWAEEFMMEKYPNGKPGVDKHPGCYWGPLNWIYRKGEEACQWRTKFGQLSFDSQGAPQLADIKAINPPEGFTLIEISGFTADDKGIIGPYVDLKQSQDGSGLYPDVYTWNLDGSNLKQITKTPVVEEEAVFSPDGKKIAFKSMDKYPATIDELYLMDADGQNRIQLTHFNTPGYAEYNKDAKQITEQSWDPSGASILLGQVSTGDVMGPHIPSDIYRLNFEGNCGNQK